jgi:hypothetical protein
MKDRHETSDRPGANELGSGFLTQLRLGQRGQLPVSPHLTFTRGLRTVRANWGQEPLNLRGGMEEFLAAEGRRTQSTELRVMIKWVRVALCNHRAAQQVVNHRAYAPGKLVTSAMAADPRDRRAHGCPFVLDSIDARLFFIEKSLLGDADEAAIETLIGSQIDDFKNRVPAYDPAKTQQASPNSSLLKTYLTVFPNIDARNQCPLMIRVRDRLKADFMKNGMMLGEFFPKYKSQSLYAGNSYHALSAPYPAFAVRYMVADDRIFATQPPYKSLFEAYFP